MSLGSMYWNGRFSAWPPAADAVDGYSLLMPVPGDLPVFLELALATCATQEHEHRVETIVLPDRPTKQVSTIVERARPGWAGDLRLQPFPHPERHLLPALKNPFHNYGIQLLTGVSAARGSHVILHDADLFLARPGALDDRYRRTRDADLYVSGVSPVWDDWYAERGLSIVATWEQCARRDWIRSFPPSLHMGHEAELLGERHVFDITLHPQALTDQRRIAIHEDEAGIVHFNYVIATYRHFQKAPAGFADDRFRLLLIRLFVDLFAQLPYDYAVPSIGELARGLGSAHAPVTYPTPDADTVAAYRDYRGKIDTILTGAWVPGDRGERCQEALAPFDVYYARSATP